MISKLPVLLFFMYARALQKKEPERRLYLAVRRNTFETLFQEEVGQLLLEEPGFRIIVSVHLQFIPISLNNVTQVVRVRHCRVHTSYSFVAIISVILINFIYSKNIY